MIPLDAHSLTDDEKKKAMPSLTFLTEKQDRSVKAWHFADRRKQQEYIQKDESASPTVSYEAIFITCAIEAKEQRKVAIVDVIGILLHAINDEDAIMYMPGRLAKLMTMVGVKVQKALYLQ